MIIETVGIITTVLAVAGVLLNNRLNKVCFLLWIISNTLSAMLHACLGVWSLFVRDAIFLVLSIEGYIIWGSSDSLANVGSKNWYKNRLRAADIAIEKLGSELKHIKTNYHLIRKNKPKVTARDISKAGGLAAAKRQKQQVNP